MINAIMLGLSTISSIIGYNNYSYHDFNHQDLINVANYVNREIIKTNDNEDIIDGTHFMIDLYTLEGENRYTCFDFNSSYLIYDKKYNEVDEYSLTTNPYTNYKGDFCTYTENNRFIKYGTVDQKSFFNIQTREYLEETFVLKSMDNNSEAGKWLNFDDYGADVTKIPNSYYFENLHSRHGINDDGSCAIVAIQILLGYYDTYLNDLIVPENFDVITKEYETSFPSFVQSPGTDDTFHDELISFAKDKGISDDGTSLNIIQEKNLAIQYLNSRDIDYSYKWVEGNWADTTTNEASKHIRSAIDSGRPIFIGGAGHATVAYAYDSNYVYMHSGWGDVRRTPWATYNTDIWDFIGGPHTIDITNINSHYHSDNYFSLTKNKYLCTCGMSFLETTLGPSEYGFESEYFFAGKDLSVTKEGLTFNTKRLRTGYIENQVLNLSPRRNGAGTAYLEYYFDNVIKKIKVDLSFWSNKENLSSIESTVLFQYLNPINNQWVTKVDLLNDIILSTDRYHQPTYTFDFPHNTKGFRFYSTSSAVGDRNKGRLSIGDMVIEYA